MNQPPICARRRIVCRRVVPSDLFSANAKLNLRCRINSGRGCKDEKIDEMQSKTPLSCVIYLPLHFNLAGVETAGRSLTRIWFREK